MPKPKDAKLKIAQYIAFEYFAMNDKHSSFDTMFYFPYNLKNTIRLLERNITASTTFEILPIMTSLEILGKEYDVCELMQSPEEIKILLGNKRNKFQLPKKWGKNYIELKFPGENNPLYVESVKEISELTKDIGRNYAFKIKKIDISDDVMVPAIGFNINNCIIRIKLMDFKNTNKDIEDPIPTSVLGRKAWIKRQVKTLK